MGNLSTAIQIPAQIAMLSASGAQLSGNSHRFYYIGYWALTFKNSLVYSNIKPSGIITSMNVNIQFVENWPIIGLYFDYSVNELQILVYTFSSKWEHRQSHY